MIAILASSALTPAWLYAQSASLQTEQTVREAEDQPKSILFPSGVPAPYYPNDAEIARAAQERLNQPVQPSASNDEVIDQGDQAITEVVELIEADKSAYGTLAQGNGGLAKNIWQPSSFEQIEKLLEVLSLPSRSPAMDDISRRLLLSFATAPTGEPIAVEVDQGENRREERPVFPVQQSRQFDEALLKRFIALRLSELTERGNLTDLVAFLQNLPQGTLEPVQENAEILLLGGDIIGACQMTQQARRLTEERNNRSNRFAASRTSQALSEEDIFWLKMLSFCRVLEENNDGAQIALDILNEQENADYIFFDLLNRLMENPQSRRNLASSGMTTPDPLNYTILTLMDQPINAELIDTSPPLVVSALVINPNLSPESRFQAAVKSYRSGGVSAQVLSNIYDLQEVTDMELNNAMRLAQFDERPMADVLLYQAALRQSGDLDKASILNVIWQRASEDNDMARKASVNIDTLVSLNPDARLMSHAHQITRGLLLGGETQRAVQWYQFARRSAASGNAQATQALINIWPLILIASDRGAIPWSEDLLNLWWNGQMVLAPESRDSKATLFYAASEAFGYQVSEDKWSELLSENHPENVVSIPLGVWREMIRAVGENKPAQAIILSLIAMGPDGPGSLDASGLSTVIRLLRSFGLEQQARNVAIEALVANQF